MSRRIPTVGLVACAGLLGSFLVACAPFGTAAPTTVPPTATMAAPTATVPPTLIPTAPPTSAATATAVPAPTPTQAATATATAIPTATPRPPTATTVPTVPPTFPATATLPPPPPTAVATTLLDVQQRCAVTLPAGWQTGTPGTASGVNGGGGLSLSSLQAEPDDTLDDVALPYISTTKAKIAGYQQTKVTKGADNLRIDFTGTIGQPGTGTFYLRQYGSTVCAMAFFVMQGTELAYETTLASLQASLRLANAVGITPHRPES